MAANVDSSVPHSPLQRVRGFDCGFHCEPNPYVDRLLHYQERVDGGGYTYEPVAVGAYSATGLLWELLDALADRLGAE